MMGSVGTPSCVYMPQQQTGVIDDEDVPVVPTHQVSKSTMFQVTEPEEAYKS